MLGAEYTAAFIDGEGCIRICVQQARSGKRRSMSRSHRLVIEVANVHPGVVLALRDRWGGRIDLRTTNRKTPAFHWRIWSLAAAAMLEAVQPYMIVKRDEAELALEFMAKGQFQRSGRSKRLTAKVLDLRESYKLRIEGMHSRKGGGNIRPEYEDIQKEAIASYGV